MCIERKLNRTLTVGQLIEKLQEHSLDAKVLIGCDYGDRHHTTQALTIHEVEELPISETAYSSSGMKVRSEEEPEEEGEVYAIVIQ